VKRLG